jgi:hypothetical protein
MRREWGVAGMLLTVLLVPQLALAQRTNATVNVEVSEEGRAAPAGVTVTAINTNTGATAKGTPRGDGVHVLPGLPPGEYLITALPPSGKEASRWVKLEVGQTMNLDIDLAERAPVIEGETVMVEGRLTDATSSEIAVNVTREQIENLPQMNRNFLSFAQLAPGVRINDDEFRKDVQAGGLLARQTNVFVDGVSLKNNVLEGGVIGQDASRGNPFPQLAVEGFRVISQNFKAEYEQAGAAVITATTRSGGNDFHADLFATFQNKDLVARDYFALQKQQPRPELARYQLGAGVGGPVVKDKLFFFLTYEANLHNRANAVAVKNASLIDDPALLSTLRTYEGQFISPFREHLGFGKLSWRPEDNQMLEVSASLRRESDIRSFGNENSYENAEDVRINTTTALAKHQWWLGSVLNEAALQYLMGQWNPAVLNPDKPGLLYDGVLKIGGRDTTQDIIQQSFTIRDDVSMSDLHWAGHHFVKTGARVALQDYKAATYLFGNPLFKFRSAESFAFPFEAKYGVGDPQVHANNTQIGLYVQDDWQPTKRLTLNVGVRWDVESNALNNSHRTPDDIRAAVTAWAPSIVAATGRDDYFPVEKFLTDGTQRPAFLGAVQPRIGFTYDVLGNESTILFGGAGRYYDRTLFVYSRGELERLNFDELTYRFSADGSPRDGAPTIAWQSGFTPTKELLDALRASGQAPKKEIWLLENDTKPPHSDMYSLGVRQHAGPVNASLTFTHVVNENEFGWYIANRHPETKQFLPTPDGYGNVIISSDERQARYTAFQLAIEKPFSSVASTGFFRWGASLAYTLGYSFQRGDGFYFDFPDPKTAPWSPGETDERHRLIFSAVTAWPYEITLSTMVTLGSGLPYTIKDESLGDTDALREIRRYSERADGLVNYSQIDLRLGKDFTVARRHKMGAFVEVFNLLNTRNFGGYNGDIFFDRPNPEFGEPTKLIGPTRSLQAGVRYSF